MSTQRQGQTPKRNRPSSARPSAGRPSPDAGMRRKAIYKKSKYYRQRRARLTVLGCAGAVFLLLAAFLALRAQGSQAVSTASSEAPSPDQNVTGEILPEDPSSATPSPEPTPAPTQAPVTLTVSVVGDCTLGTDESFNYSTSLNAYCDSYGPEYFLSNVKSIFEADDLTIANMEGTLTQSTAREPKTFAFKAPPSYAKILSSGGVEAVTLANNHSHDYGEQGFTDTKTALDGEGIVHFGYDETALMEIKGVKVGLVGIYELNDHLGCQQQLIDNIAAVKSQGAQLVIVIFHWGNEKETVPDTNQMTLGRLAIDEGAHLVCGHHSHVLQGIESYKGKRIVYSLGNFCFGGNSAPSDSDTMVFQQTFTITDNGAEPNDDVTIIPCSISSAYGYNNYQPTPAQDDEKARILSKIEERSSWIPAAQIADPPA